MPELVCQARSRDGTFWMEQQERQQGALSRTAEREPLAVPSRLYGSEQEKLEVAFHADT